MSRGEAFDPGCCRCPRLVALRARVRRDYPHYHAAPVAPFGDARARLLIVGLAPGMHGANRHGRPFTGDASAAFLLPSLDRFGFANQPRSERPGDGLRLTGCRIVNAVACLPPGNRPGAAEIRACNGYLTGEIERLTRRARRPRVILTLGRIAHEAVLAALDASRSAAPFGHARTALLAPRLTVLSSYHPSRQNVNTGRLTRAMLDAVLARASELLAGDKPV